MVTHAHFDHYGGSVFLKQQFGADGFDRLMAIYDECINAQFARSVAAGADKMRAIHRLVD